MEVGKESQYNIQTGFQDIGTQVPTPSVGELRSFTKTGEKVNSSNRLYANLIEDELLSETRDFKYRSVDKTKMPRLVRTSHGRVQVAIGKKICVFSRCGHRRVNSE